MVHLNHVTLQRARLRQRQPETENLDLSLGVRRGQFLGGGGRRNGDAIYTLQVLSTLPVPKETEVSCVPSAPDPSSSLAPISPAATTTTPNPPPSHDDGDHLRGHSERQCMLGTPGDGGSHCVHKFPSLDQATLVLRLQRVNFGVAGADVDDHDPSRNLAVTNWPMGVAVMLFTVIGGALVYLKPETQPDVSYPSPVRELLVAAAYSTGYLSLGTGLMLALYIVINPDPTPKTEATTRALVCIGLVWVTAALLVQIVCAQPKSFWPPVTGITVLGIVLTVVAFVSIRSGLQARVRRQSHRRAALSSHDHVEVEM